MRAGTLDGRIRLKVVDRGDPDKLRLPMVKVLAGLSLNLDEFSVKKVANVTLTMICISLKVVEPPNSTWQTKSTSWRRFLNSIDLLASFRYISRWP